MTMYQNAMVAGAGAIKQLASVPAAGRAAYDQAFGATYGLAMAKYRAELAQQAIRSNIANVLQNKILSDVELQVNQAEAEAAARVSAAAAGAAGASVDQTIDQTRVNADRATSTNEKAARSEMSNLAAGVGEQQAVLNSKIQLEDYGSFSSVLLGAGAGMSTVNFNGFDFDAKPGSEDPYEASSVWDFEQSDFD